MEILKFNSYCPFEIGDKVEVGGETGKISFAPAWTAAIWQTRYTASRKNAPTAVSLPLKAGAGKESRLSPTHPKTTAFKHLCSSWGLTLESPCCFSG